MLADFRASHYFRKAFLLVLQGASGGSIFTKRKPYTLALCRPSGWACLWRALGATSNLAYSSASPAD